MAEYKNADCAELEALFDSIAGQAAAPATPSSEERVFNRVGRIMRQLNDALHEMGYDEFIEKAVSSLPDTQDRLNYIATLTEQAACRVLNATDAAQPCQEALRAGAASLGERWERLYANRLSVEEFKALAADTRAFVQAEVPARTEATNAQLLEIVMAQDFQDLTGQVIRKVVGLVQDLERQLMGLLVEFIPEERRNDSVNSLLNGPVIKAEGRTDVVVNQSQVDDLLDSLGF